LVYKILCKESVEKDLKRINKNDQILIIDAIETKLANDPYELGKPLKGQYKGLWRYRVGDYRIIYRISDAEVLVLILRIAHRKESYK